MTTSTVTLTAADGFTSSAYLCEPAGRPKGAIVVLQEIFGVNSHIRGVADGYAAAGYRVIAPATFDRVARDVVDAVAADPGRLAGIDLRTLMTHLACADAPEHPLNAQQATRFAAIRARLPAAPASLANSSGMFLGEGFGSDLARPGCALYGINPTPGRPNPMRQVVTLRAPVLQVREIPAGATVGYGATWTAPRPSRIATVAAGYADGYLRSLSGRAIGILAGRPVPLVGRVSMDLITFDVTDLPEPALGDAVELIGPGNTPDDVAARAGTIGYEVLTSLGRRYRREVAGA
jgi:alanine racemase